MPSGGGSSDATIYTNLIPTYIPGVQDRTVTYLAQALLLSINTFATYSGATYAAQNANEIAGIAALSTRGSVGSVIESDAETYLQALFSGLYDVTAGLARLDTAFQAKIDEIVQSMNDTVLPGILDDHIFSFGGSEHNVDQALAAKKTMALINELSESLYYTAYRNERRSEDAGLSHAIPYGQRGMRDAELLRQSGTYKREYTQQGYIDAWNKWNEENVIPVRNLDILGNAVRSILGITRSATTKYYKPPAINQIAGAALVGVSIYSMFRDTTMSAYKNPAGLGLFAQNQKTVEAPQREYALGENIIDMIPEKSNQVDNTQWWIDQYSGGTPAQIPQTTPDDTETIRGGY